MAAAAALEENTIRHDEVFFCEKGGMMRNDRMLRDHKPFVYLTFPEVIENSSNICMVKINERVTSERFTTISGALDSVRNPGLTCQGSIPAKFAIRATGPCCPTTPCQSGRKFP